MSRDNPRKISGVPTSQRNVHQKARTADSCGDLARGSPPNDGGCARDLLDTDLTTNSEEREI